MNNPSIHSPHVYGLESNPSPQKQKLRMDSIMSSIREWDYKSCKVFSGHNDTVWSCAITSDNKYAFSGSQDQQIKIWEVESQRMIGELEEHTDTVSSLLLIEDNKYLISGGWDNCLYIWDWRNRALESTLEGHTGSIFCITKTNSEKILASGSQDKTAILWDIQSRTQLTKFVHNDSVFAIAFDPNDTEMVTGGGDQKLRIFAMKDFSLVSIHDINAGMIESLVFTWDSQYLVFGTRSNLVKVWDYKTKTEYHTFVSHTYWVRQVISIEEDLIISVSCDKTIRMFSIQEKSEILELKGSENFIYRACLSKDNQYLLTVGSDKLMKLWSFCSPKRVRMLKGHTDSINSLDVSKDNKWIVTGSADRTVRIWSFDEGFEVARLEGHTGIIWMITITNDMKFIASASADKRVILWNFSEKSKETELNGHSQTVFCIAASQNSQFLASGSKDKSIILWNIISKSIIGTLTGHEDSVLTLKFMKNNEIISGSADSTIRVWNMINFTQTQKIDSTTTTIDCLALSYDEKFLGVGGRDNSFNLWAWRQKRNIKKFINHTDWVTGTSAASNSNLFVTVSFDKTVQIWNADEKRHECTLKGHTGKLKCAAFTNDGKHIVSCGGDKTIMIWNIKNISQLEVIDIDKPTDSYFYLKLIQTKAVPTLKSYKSTFSPLKINLLHIYSYLGYADLLRKALLLGFEIRIDDDGYSPMHYALIRESQEWIDVLIEIVIAQAEHDHSAFIINYYAMRNDFADLIKNRSIHLLKFLNVLLYRCEERRLPLFAVPKSALPIIYFTEDRIVDPDDFVYKPCDSPVHSIEKFIEFKATAIPILFSEGSFESIELLQNIRNCLRIEILESNTINSIIVFKWKILWPFVLTQSLVIWTNLLLMTWLVVESSQWIIVVFFVIVNIALLFYEVVQMMVIGIQEYFGFWNLIDFGRVILSFMFVFLYIQQSSSSFYSFITWLMLLISFFRGLTAFSAFSQTRFYLKLICRSIFDTFSFLIIFFYSIFTFGVLYYASISINKTGAFSTKMWKLPFELNMKGFNEENIGSGLEFTFYMLASVVNVIIILNLLISILRDNFQKFQIDSVRLDRIEMLDLIIEYEKLMFWNRKHGKKRYIIGCFNRDSHTIDTDWQAKIFKIEERIEDCSNKVISALKTELDSNKYEWNTRIKNLEDRIQEMEKNYYEKLQSTTKADKLD